MKVTMNNCLISTLKSFHIFDVQFYLDEVTMISMKYKIEIIIK